jgi:hypothetical protein
MTISQYVVVGDMKRCRFVLKGELPVAARFGLLETGGVHDSTEVTKERASLRWPLPPGGGGEQPMKVAAIMSERCV